MMLGHDFTRVKGHENHYTGEVLLFLPSRVHDAVLGCNLKKATG